MIKIAVTAASAFALLGAGNLGITEDHRTLAQPPVNAGLVVGEPAWRQPDGGHEDRSSVSHSIVRVDRSYRARWPSSSSTGGAVRSFRTATDCPLA